MERVGIWFQRDRTPYRPTVLGLIIGLVVALPAVWPVPAHGQATRPGGEGASKAPLARYVPRQDLLAYLEFDGLDSHADAWKKSAAYKLLNDTKLGALLENLVSQGLERLLPGGGDSQVKPAEMIDLVKHVATHGGAIGAWGFPDGADQGKSGIVFAARRADRPEVRRMLEAVAPRKFARPGQIVADPAPVQKAGRTFYSIDERGGWWFENGDLVVTNRPDFVMSVLDGKEPNAVDHPIRVDLFKAKEDFQPVAVGFLDGTSLPPLPPQAVQLGLDGLKRIEIQWGIQDDAIVAVLGAVAPAPRRGILALLDQPTFNIRSLPPLPASSNAFAVLSLDFAKTYDLFVELVKQSNPQGGDGFPQLEAAFRQRFGLELRNDLLASLGPKVFLYSQPSNAGAAADPATAGFAPYTGLTFSAQVHGDAVARGIDPLMQFLNQVIQARQAGGRRGPANPNVESSAFRKRDAARPTYVLDLAQGGLPPPIVAMFQPTIVLGKDQLVLAATTSGAEKAADLSGAAEERLWRPTGAFVPMARRLARDLVFLNVSDPRDTLPELIQSLPALSAQLNLLVPAVQSARGAARRAQCTNNLKQIALAMHNYLFTNNAFPRSAITDKAGKPLLSWRVAILPFVEQQPLYNRFKLDEPWDSPHNKELIKEIPPVYLCPERTNAAPFTTIYRVFTGKGAVFEDGQDVGFAQITDGTSNTIMVAESTDAVTWTKPDDLKFDPNEKPSLYGAGSSHDGGFNAALADGSVHFIARSIQPVLFRAAITRDAGEVLNFAQISRPQPQARGPVAGGLLRVDPNALPRADELRPLLFPGSLAIVSDRNGVRIVSRESFPSVSSPAVSGVLVGLLFPAVQSAREAARRAQCVNNLKQMALAMHNYVSATNAFPRPALTDKDGKPLLSWRVAILPYVEQQALYNRFKLDEPWDSPHNKELIKEIPPVFVCPDRANVEPGTTTYRVFVGAGALFEKGQDTGIQQITDGTSNTLMIAESTDAVPWTKPDAELPFDPAQVDPEAKPSLFGAGSLHPGGFNAAMADGSVRFFKTTINFNVFRALITRAGGEVINADAF